MLRSLAPLLVIAICVLVVVGCGGSGSSNTGSPSPSPTATHGTGSWSADLSGAITGSVAGNAFSSCTETDGSFRITLDGPVQTAGGQLSVTVGSFASGSFDLAQQSSGLAITAKYTPPSGAETNFAANAGATGASGTVAIGAAGGGNMSVTMPPIVGAAPLTISATWNCS